MQQDLGIQDGSNDKRYFTIIPNYILNHSTLWDREIYIQMKRIAGENGVCWTSQTTLSKQCGMSINRLKKSLAYLLEHNWIKLIGTKKVGTKGGNQEVNEYRICDLWKINTDFYKDKGVSQEDIPLYKGVSPNRPKGCHESAKGVSPGDDKEDPMKKNPIKEDTAIQGIAGKEIAEIIDLFKSINPSYKKFFGNKTQRAAISRLLEAIGRERLEGAIRTLPKTNQMTFAPVITTPLQLEDKLAALMSFILKEKIKTEVKSIAIL